MNRVRRTIARIKIGNRKTQLFKLLKYAPIPIALVLILVIIGRVRANKNSSNSNSSSQQVSGTIVSAQIDKSFDLPINNKAGEEIGKLKYIIESAEKRKEIYVKGQKASAASGREFLIINLKIVNDLDRGVDVNTRDYVRLSVNNSQLEWSAPDIHNDPVEVQAISTKKARIGFPINDTDEQLMIQIGEVSGNKETVKLEF